MGGGMFAVMRRKVATSCGICVTLGLAIGLVSSALLVQGCGSSEELTQMPVEQRFELAMKKFQDEDYLDAREDFRVVTLQFQGSALADDAQFYFAECYFRREEFTLAAYEYDLLVRAMPTSEYVARARYQRAMCSYKASRPYYLDQQETRRAVDEFQTFIEYHPTDSLVLDAEARIAELNAKLARKEYENGTTYMRMEYYRAAVNSFDQVLEKFHDTPYAEEAQLKKVEALILRNRHGEAKAELDRFFSRYPNSRFKSDAEKLRKEIEDKLSKGGSSANHLKLVAPGGPHTQALEAP